MAESTLESRVEKVEARVTEIGSRVDIMAQKVDDFVQEMRDFKTEMRDFKAEMRDRDNQRAAEIARVDAKIERLREQREADMKAIAERREADMKAIAERQEKAAAKHEAEVKAMNAKIDEKFDKLSSQIQNIAVAAVVGVGAIVWAVVSALK